MWLIMTEFNRQRHMNSVKMVRMANLVSVEQLLMKRRAQIAARRDVLDEQLVQMDQALDWLACNDDKKRETVLPVVWIIGALVGFEESES
jgi:hypothetical protein